MNVKLLVFAASIVLIPGFVFDAESDSTWLPPKFQEENGVPFDKIICPDDLELKAGMIVTIEPGIYLPGKFGVRIEDDVLIEKGGCRELTSASRKLIVV